jgi:hypothetical protein
MKDLTDAMTSGFGDAATGILGAIGDILPVLIPIAAAVVLITVGFKVFKKIGKG